MSNSIQHDEYISSSELLGILPDVVGVTTAAWPCLLMKAGHYFGLYGIRYFWRNKQI